jgi:general secretion pathway protein N
MVTRTALPATAATGGRWVVLGVLIGAALAFSLFAPARWLAAGLAQWSNGHLQLVNARGTVWNGTAGVVFSSGASGAESISLPGMLGWTLRPRWDGVAAALDIPCCAAQALQFKARPRASGLQLDWRDSQSRWPAALLGGFGAPWNTLKPEGVLDISTQAFAMHWNGPQLALDGRATLDATDISSSLSTLRPMGSYRITLEGGPSPTLLLTTREGSLQLSGSGRWNGTALRFDGEASAAPGREDALSNLLNIIGRRDGARSLITLG